MANLAENTYTSLNFFWDMHDLTLPVKVVIYKYTEISNVICLWNSLLIYISLSLCLIIFCGGWKIAKFVLSMLRESLLHDNQVLIWGRLLFITDSRSKRLLLVVQNRLESSAKRWKSNMDVLLWKSFMYNRNNRGPSTEPCGTPQGTRCSFDFALPIDTNCLLLLR